MGLKGVSCFTVGCSCCSIYLETVLQPDVLGGDCLIDSMLTPFQTSKT